MYKVCDMYSVVKLSKIMNYAGTLMHFIFGHYVLQTA